VERCELRVGYLGRLDPPKGVHLLRDALRRARHRSSVQLLLAGPPGTDEDYARATTDWAASDERVRYLGVLEPGELSWFFSTIDVLAVPSLFPEIGPLVVLESLAHGVPVLGSDLGGIAEWVRSGVNGQLIPTGEVGAWSAAIDAYVDKIKQGALPSFIPLTRTMTDVAEEMRAIYSEVMSTGSSGTQ